MTGPRDLLAIAAKAAVASYRGRVLSTLRGECVRLHEEAERNMDNPGAEAMARLEANTFETAAMIVEAVPQEI